MLTKYSITCRCGRKWKVEARQAGEQIDCSCGEKIEVPTLRGLALLPQVEVNEPARSSWTRAQGIIFVAAIAWLAIGAVVTWWLWTLSTRPVEVLRFEREGDELSSRVETLTPAESIQYWRMFRDEPARMLNGPRRVRGSNMGNERYVWITWVAAAVTLAGAGGIGLGLMMTRRKPQAA